MKRIYGRHTWNAIMEHIDSAQQTKVSPRAALARINRRLARKHQRLSKTHVQYQHNLGEYHLIDTYYNVVLGTHCSLEHMAKKLGVLNAFETIAS